MTGQGRILLVADTPASADALQLQLSNAGYDVFVAEDDIAPPPCDVVVVDVSRLRFGPFTALQSQRRMGCSAPAMLLAARLTEQMAAEMFSLGVRDFVLKPVDDEILLSRLMMFVQEAAQATEQDDTSAKDLENIQSRHSEEIATLSRIGRAITALTDIDIILSHIVDASVFLTHAAEGALFLADTNPDTLTLRAEKGLEAKQAEAIRRPSSDSEAMEVLRTGKPVMKSGEVEHKVKTGFLVRALINVPILAGSKVIGVLAVYNHGAQSFRAIDQTLLSSLADYASIALDKVQSIETTKASTEGKIEAAREIALHAETLLPPVQSVESLVKSLLDGGLGSLSEEQSDAVHRIRQVADRLNEIHSLIEIPVQKILGDRAEKPS
jgi:GAF domain-containing protein